MPQLPIPQHLAERSASMPKGGVKPALPSGVDLSGLTQGIAAGADTMERAEAEGRKARVGAAMADLDLQVTQTEVESRKTYDPASDKSHVEELRAQLDGLAESRLRNEDHRVSNAVRQEYLALRAQTLGRGVVFEANARADHRKRTLDDSLGKRTVTAELDPMKAFDLMAMQLAEIRSSTDLTPPQRADLEDRTRKGIALGALTTVASHTPSAVRDHPLLAFVAPEKLTNLLKFSEKSQQMIEAQGVADEIMASGMPLDEAMRHVEKTFDGETEHAIKVELQGRYATNEAARKDREQEWYGKALLEVEQRGRVTPATWAGLTDMHRAAVLNRQQAEARQRRLEAEGRSVKTDMALYLSLREMADAEPAKFRQYDLRQHVDKIGAQQMEQLLDIKSRLTAAGAKPVRESVTLTQQLSATMQAVGIKQAAKRGAFLSFVQTEVDEATQAKGKPLTFEERQALIDKALLQGPDPDAWLWGTKRMFELTPQQRQRFKPDAATDAPPTEHDALNEALRAQGLPQTPTNRLTLYQRTMSRATR